jgi:hypothetical protein
MKTLFAVMLLILIACGGGRLSKREGAADPFAKDKWECTTLVESMLAVNTKLRAVKYGEEPDPVLLALERQRLMLGCLHARGWE